jgi:sarcosine oxidase
MWFRSAFEDQCITAFPQFTSDQSVSFFVKDTNADAEVGDAANCFFERHVHPFFGGISPQLGGSNLCYYTTTPDGGFIVDRHPDHDRLLVLSACSGHGFKHSLAVGELGAQMLLGEGIPFDTSPFSVGRLNA